jgi:Flp pilus assembly protein TadD
VIVELLKMNELQPPNTHHVRAAQGWLELGCGAEANEELEKITPDVCEHPDVLEVRWGIRAAATDWEACLAVAIALVEVAPQRLIGWIHRSYALHELRRTSEAAKLLTPAVALFPDDWLIRYNLACYASQLGNQVEARDWLQKAFKLGNKKEIELMAQTDADLKPLLDSIREGLIPPWKD